MHPMMMIDVRPRMGTMLGLVVVELIDGARAGNYRVDNIGFA